MTTTYDIFSHSIDGKTVKVYAIEANLTYFVTDTPVTGVAGAPITYAVKGSTVHRFPGDPNPFNRAGFTAKRSLPVARGRAIPGKPFVLSDGIETRQFSYVGSLSTLYAYLTSSASRSFNLVSPSGASRQIVKNP
jgi:hypothetical protein